MNRTPYKAPDFSLEDRQGTVRSLKGYTGKWGIKDLEVLQSQ